MEIGSAQEPTAQDEDKEEEGEDDRVGKRATNANTGQENEAK